MLDAGEAEMARTQPFFSMGSNKEVRNKATNDY